MEILFYLFALVIPLAYEVKWIVDYTYVKQIWDDHHYKNIVCKESSDLNEMAILYTVWIMIGLFTYNGYIFVFLLLMAYAHKLVNKKWFCLADSWIGIISIIFIILNKFWLRIDLFTIY